MKEVGVPLTGMGRAAAAVLVPVTGSGAVSPAPSASNMYMQVCVWETIFQSRPLLVATVIWQDSDRTLTAHEESPRQVTQEFVSAGSGILRTSTNA